MFKMAESLNKRIYLFIFRFFFFFFETALVDDRLQTPCNKPGKHHCPCEEEDIPPPSPVISRQNRERKRRRSLPCGPTDTNNCVTIQPIGLPSVQETVVTQEKKDVQSSSYPKYPSEIVNNRSVKSVQNQNCKLEENAIRNRKNLNADNLERCFKAQLNIDGREGNVEKRYKRTIEDPPELRSSTNCKEKQCNLEKKHKEAEKSTEKNGIFENLIPFNPSLPWSFVESWNNSNANGKCAFQSLRANRESYFNDSERINKPAVSKDSSLVINPFRQPSPFHESNPGPSTNNRLKQDSLNSSCMVHQSCVKSSNKLSNSESNPGLEAVVEEVNNRGRSGKDLSQLISKLSFPEDKEKSKEEGGFLDWFSKVPGRVLGVAPASGFVENKVKATNLKSQEQQQQNEVRFKNCNLELSQQEFDEVLAVLRARTPSERKRTGIRTIKKREKLERSVEDGSEKSIGKYGNLESIECSANNIVNRAKPCEGCNHKLCRKNDQQALEKTNFVEIYGNKNIYNPREKREKLESDESNEDLQAMIKCNNSEKRSNDGAMDCLQNVVSNKADILLGAILRTSKDRGSSLSEIQNGTKSRSVPLPTGINETESNRNSVACEKSSSRQEQRTAPLEDDKFLPMVLNKRFNRFRQLFKKEQEKKSVPATTEDNSQDAIQHLARQARSFSYNNVQPSLHDPKNLRDSKAKRRIDFSNFGGEREAEKRDDPSELSTNGAHQNSNRIYSTNYKKEDSGDYDEVEMSKWRNRLHSTNEDDGVTELDDDEDGGVVSKLCKDSVSSVGKKIRCHNLGKDIIATDDDETMDKAVPTAIEQERFRRSLENAASMVFHSRTGLPLTSSPAPLRRGSCCFDYDSSLNTVSSKRRYGDIVSKRERSKVFCSFVLRQDLFFPTVLALFSN